MSTLLKALGFGFGVLVAGVMFALMAHCGGEILKAQKASEERCERLSKVVPVELQRDLWEVCALAQKGAAQ